MEYKFFKEKVSQSTYIGVKPLVDKYDVFFRFMGNNWTAFKLQEIIDGIEEGKSRPLSKPYEWASEDILMISNINGVSMIDLLGHRAGERDPQKLEFKFTHEEMIAFFQDFKKFVSEPLGSDFFIFGTRNIL